MAAIEESFLTIGTRIMFINRSWNRTESDDFKLNVEPQLRDNKEAVPQYYEGKIVGWVIQYKYE